MSTQDQTIGGGAELDALLRTLPGKMQRNINRAGLRAGASVFLREVRDRIPVASGDMRRTARITGRIRDGEVHVSVKVGGKTKGVDVWYARMVEYGTKAHYIKVSDEERGRNRRTGNLVTMGTVNRRVLQIGATFVGPVVHHPGARARPFMRPAVDAKFTEAVTAIREKIRERLTNEGLNVPAPLPVDPEE